MSEQPMNEMANGTETEEPVDLDVPAELDAAWVASALPSGTITMEAMQAAGWDALTPEVQAEAEQIVEDQTPPETPT